MKQLVLLSILQLVCGITFSQNLVPNGSFETIKVSPSELNSKFRPSAILEGWREVAMGEIGVIHPKSSYFNPQKSQHGSQVAQDGESYGWFKAAGIPFGELGDVKRYYFQTKLTESLQKGKKYKFSFYVSLADNSSIAVATIGAFFFDKPIPKRGDSPQPLYKAEHSSQGNQLDLVDQVASTKIKNPHGIIKDMENWTLIEEEFTAQGTETFLVIGNFEMQWQMKYETMPKKKEHWNWKDSYYFLDNISLVAVEEPLIAQKTLPLEVNTAINELAKGKTVVMENVLFETTSHELLPSSFATLDSIAAMMTENKTIHVIVEGHTDNIGDSLSNQKLSFLRAESVKNYLIKHKIAATRIEINGFGATIPLLPNTTAQGRRRNRRVSVRAKKKY